MEWQSTSSGGVWQLNGGPDADGILCIVTRVDDTEFLWSVDNVGAHKLIAHGSKGTLDEAKAAAEHAYSPLFPLSLFAQQPEGDTRRSCRDHPAGVGGARTHG